MKKIAVYLSLSLIAAFNFSQAQTSLYWDANGATTGLGGTGNWTTTGANWATNNSSGTASVGSGAWTSGNGNIAVFAGTAGTVSLSSGTVTGGKVQVDTTGYTLMNSSTGTTSANRYVRATNGGFFLGNNVNLNISSGITTNGAITGFQGPFTNSVGTTGASLTVTGATLNADSSVRIGFDGSETDIWVPLTIATTGSGYASLKNVGGTNSIYGTVTVNSGSKLTFGASSSSRRINVRGNLTTVNSDLTIGDGSGDVGMVVLYGNNTIGGNVLLKYGQLGYGTNNTAFGNATIVISDGTSFGQQGGIGTTDADRTIANKISLLGNATFGLGSYSTYMSGDVDLNGGVRTVTLGNSTYFNGRVTNGGLSMNSSSATRILYLNGSNTLTELSWTNGIVSFGVASNSIASLTMSNTNSTNFPTLFVQDLSQGATVGGVANFFGTNANTTNNCIGFSTNNMLPGTFTLLRASSINIPANDLKLKITYTNIVGTKTNTNSVYVGLGQSLTYQRSIFAFTNTGTELKVTISENLTPDLTWSPGTNAVWNYNSENQPWLFSETPSSFNSGDNAIISGGGTLDIDPVTGINAGYVTVSGSSNAVIQGGNLTAYSLEKTNSGNLTLSANLTLSQGFNLNGGTTTLSGALSGTNLYTGNIYITNATLVTAGAERLPDTGTVFLSTNSVLRLGGNETLVAINASTNSAATVDLQSYALTLNVTTSNSYGAAITGSSGGSLIKNGSSILTVNENNTFTGGTILNDGAFRLQASGNRLTNGSEVTLSSSPFGLGTLTIAGGRIFSSSTGGRTVYNSVNITGNFSIGDSSATQNGDITVSTNVNTPPTTTLLATDVNLNTLSLTDWEQPISGAGFSLTKTGTNRLILRGANNLSALTVQTGRLDLRGVNTIASGIVDVSAGASLGWGTTNGALGSCVIKLGNNGAIGQAGDMGTTTDDRKLPNQIKALGDFVLGLGGYGTLISGNIDLSGGIRKVGLTNSTSLYGSVTNGGLSIDALTYTNAAPVTRTLSLFASNNLADGITLTSTNSVTNRTLLVLAVANNQALGSGSLTFAANPSATLKAVVENRSLTNDMVINSGITAIFDAGTNSVVSNDQTTTNSVNSDLAISGSISGGGALSKINDGILTLSGALSYSGGTTVAGGTLRIQRSGMTADITTNTIAINFATPPALGTVAVLPGALIGAYGAANITGIGPTETATFNQTSGQVLVEALPAAPANLSYGSTELSATYGALMTTLTPTCDNSPTSYSIDPALPGGLNFSTFDGSIGGTPSAASPRSLYTVTATNAGGNTQRTFYLTVAKATPSITASPTAGAITYGQTLADSSLTGGTGSVAGTFAFTSLSTAPNAGTANQDVTFTPTDTANYNTATTTVSVTVNKATPTVSSAPTASAITDGQALSASTLSGGSGSVAGSFAWTDSSIVPAVGTSSQSVTFTPTDTANYNTATANVSVTVNAAGGISNWLGGAATNAANVGKYLIGGGTNVDAASERPVIINTNSTNLILSAIVRTNDTKGEVVGQWVTNVSGFSSLTSGSNEVAGTRSANQSGVDATQFERREFSVPRTNGTNRLFLRLKATLAP